MTNLIFVFLPLFGSIALVWVLSRIIVSSADESRNAQYIGNGQLEFAPNKRNYVAVIIFVVYLLYMSVSLVFTSLSSVAGRIGAAFWLAIALILVASFPASILVTGEGLEQLYWLRKKRSIAWKDVSAVAIDEKRNRVTIKGNGGAKIVYTRQLPEKARLMAELEKYCGDKLPAETRQRELVAS